MLQAQNFLANWVCGYGSLVSYTAKGRAWNTNDGTLAETQNAVCTRSPMPSCTRHNASLYADRAWREVAMPFRMVRNALCSGRHQGGIVQDHNFLNMQASILNKTCWMQVFLAARYAKYVAPSNPKKSAKYYCWARAQVHSGLITPNA